MTKNKGRIITTGCPIEGSDIDDIWKMAQDDPQLIYNVSQFCKKKGYPIVEQRFNVIRSDKMFYMAFWECDLVIAQE